MKKTRLKLYRGCNTSSLRTQSRSARIRKARKTDITGIHALLEPFWKRGLILQRTEDDIRAGLKQFYICPQDDDTIAGVISYHDYGKHLKEIRSLAVRDTDSRKGVGSLLVRHLIKQLSREGTPKIFVLTYSPVFFIKNGFTPVDKETLPEKIWKDCLNCADQEKCGETALVYQW